MTDAETIKTLQEKIAQAEKDSKWNYLVFGFAAATLVVAAYLGHSLVRVDQPAESIKVIGVVTGIPAFLVIAAYNRISPDGIATILGTMIGYALGKVG